MNDDFSKGQVIDKLTQKTFDAFLRYDAYNDTFQATSSNQEAEAIYLKKAIEVEIRYTNIIYKF